MDNPGNSHCWLPWNKAEEVPHFGGILLSAVPARKGLEHVVTLLLRGPEFDSGGHRLKGGTDAAAPAPYLLFCRVPRQAYQRSKCTPG